MVKQYEPVLWNPNDSLENYLGDLIKKILGNKYRFQLLTFPDGVFISLRFNS